MTDRRALVAHRRRVRDDALYLHEAARESLQDRLQMVNKRFTNVAIVTGLPDFWSAVFPDATVVPDDETLALDPGAHDLVIHAMALHWANDPVGQIVQARLALRPDGLFLAIFPGGETLHELRAALTQAEVALRGGLSPRIAPMADIRGVGALLQRAGLALPVVDSERLTVHYRDLLRLLHDLRAMGETNALAARARLGLTRAMLVEAERHYAAAYADADAGAPLPATFELLTLTGWAPDPSQPKPLRPGSAAARLADALGTEERPLKD